MRTPAALLVVLLALAAPAGATPPAGVATTPALLLGTAPVALRACPRPACGAVVVDPASGLPLTRLTDRARDGYAEPGITNEYSRADPINADGTRMVLCEPQPGSWQLYDPRPPGRCLGRLPEALGGDCEPRWDPLLPHRLYAFRGTELVAVDVRDMKIDVIHDFKDEAPAAEIAGTGGEGEPSLDGRFWTVALRNADGIPLAVVLFDKQLGRVVGRKTTFEYDLGKTELNWVSTTPLTGDPVLGWVYRPETLPDGSTHHGAVRCNKAFAPVADTLADGHADLAVTRDGREVLVYQNNANDQIEMADLADGTVTPLFPIPFPFAQGSTLNLHFSGHVRSPARRGWALVVADEPQGRGNAWLSNAMALVELAAHPRIWRLGSNYNYYGDCYFSECFATLADDGRAVVFQSNWGDATAFAGEAGRHTDVYRLDLPAGWERLLPAP